MACHVLVPASCPDLRQVPLLPDSSSSSHSSLPSVPEGYPAHLHLRTFALAIPCAWNSLFSAPLPHPHSGERKLIFKSQLKYHSPQESHSDHPIQSTLPAHLQSLITLFYFLLCTSHCLNLPYLFLYFLLSVSSTHTKP